MKNYRPEKSGCFCQAVGQSFAKEVGASLATIRIKKAALKGGLYLVMDRCG